MQAFWSKSFNLSNFCTFQSLHSFFASRNEGQRRKVKVKVKSLSSVLLFSTPWTVAHQAPLSMGFSRQEYWSGLPFPSPMHESKKWKWSHSVVSNSSRPHGLQPTRLLHPWDFPGKSIGVGCHHLLLLLGKSRAENLNNLPKSTC